MTKKCDGLMAQEDQELWVRALARVIALCSWERHFTLTVLLSTQVYKWVLANLTLVVNPAMDQHPIQGGVEILLVASCYRNRDKLQPMGHLARMQTLPFFTLTAQSKLGINPSPSLSPAHFLCLVYNSNPIQLIT